MSEEVASLAAPLMQKHNVTPQKTFEDRKKKEQKEDIIRKNLGIIERQVEEVVDSVAKVDN